MISYDKKHKPDESQPTSTSLPFSRRMPSSTGAILQNEAG